MRNFFVSYNKADKTWAEWIAWQLEEKGYTTTLQAWDFRPSENFVLKMDEAIQSSERTIAVLSPSYLSALYTQPEWAAAFAKDPQSAKGILFPVRVEECDLKGLLSQIIYIDLVGKNEVEAKNTLLSGLKTERAKPLTKPRFPGEVPRSVSRPPLFPGRTNKKISLKYLVALLLFSVVALFLFFWPQTLTRSLTPPRPCPRLESGNYHEAEATQLSGDASKDSEHLGYAGDGYVSGYGHGHPGTATTFSIDVLSDGDYEVDLCYANATGSTKTLSIYVNDERVTQTRLPNANRWDFWMIKTELLPLRSGRNTISYQKSVDDNGQVNLDFIQVAGQR
jgi:hypothetical protein